MTVQAERAAVVAPLVVPGDVHSVLQRWNDVVAGSPDAPVFADATVTLSFAEADARATAVARELLRRVPADLATPVGVLVEHTADGLVAMLAVLKTGQILVPLDQHLPADRLRTIAAQAGLRTLVADARNAAAAAALGGGIRDVLTFDELLARGGEPGPAAPPHRDAVETDPLCIVFTSGSTGEPKGVVLTHGQMLSSAYACELTFALGARDRVAMVFPYGFAAGLNVLLSAVLNGAGLWSYDPRDRGAAGLLSWITSHRLTALFCTPHLLRSMVADAPDGLILDSLRLVATTGETVFGRDVEALRPHLGPAAPFYNWLGSSEVGGLSTCRIGPSDPIPDTAIPAGTPMVNREVRILCGDGTRAPAGESGEVVVVSSYQSAGYWGNPVATAARFVATPDGRTAYHTGDLGRLDAAGDLSLIGRLDAAVKIRGFLVEPSEIEAALLASDAIAEAAVLAALSPSGSTRLVAYVAPNPRRPLESPAAIRRRLRARLPEYMVPPTIVTLVALPHNERGKVDRRQLPPAPPFEHSAVPEDRRELAVADLWAEVLGLDSVGRDDDFAELGGDSLAIEEMLTLVEERFGVSLVSSDVLEAPTVAEFTARVNGTEPSLPTHPTTLVLRSTGSRAPIFYFAGAGALGLSFSPIMRHLPDRRVYAFQAQGLETRAVPDRTVAAAVRRHLAMMRVLQPHGPYVLAGHSFGGLLALETAQQLTAAGEEVELLVLLDTFPPALMRHQVIAPDSEHAPVGELTRNPLRRLRSRFLPDGLPGLGQWRERARVPLAGLVQFSGRTQFMNFFNLAQVTARRHVVRPYAGRAVVFVTDENIDGVEVFATILRGPTSFHRVAAEHNAMLREPFASEVGAIIETELEALPG